MLSGRANYCLGSSLAARLNDVQPSQQQIGAGETPLDFPARNIWHVAICSIENCYFRDLYIDQNMFRKTKVVVLKN